MSYPRPPSTRIEIAASLGIGVLLLCIALFLDPIGNAPDTGVFDLGTRGTKWLLGILGAGFVAAGVGALCKAKGTKE
jgi:vacuolar-type H+-ATPase subunit I/STV1